MQMMKTDRFKPLGGAPVVVFKRGQKGASVHIRTFYMIGQGDGVR
jgi:hypothetical protein